MRTANSSKNNKHSQTDLPDRFERLLAIVGGEIVYGTCPGSFSSGFTRLAVLGEDFKWILKKPWEG